ncbi:MAG: potassium-transporting ATPase KdpC subunit [Chthoniobacter sp.]|jgi:K+-transporting ATPase ATPase C chain|nr:potassium-transporting ATPase KdpC subunit [Chthoniobacter sp.]
MKTILQDIITSIIATLLFAVVLCGIYPVVIWGISQLVFPHQANGSLIEGADRKIVGSEWLGQNFTGAKYFHPRPSAAGANGYDAANSSGSNLGPTSQKLIDAVKQRVADYRTENGLAADALVPGDAVTASGSGLDPHISPKNALLQAARVARERRVSVDMVKTEIVKATAGPSLGLLGEAGVNVLKLNLALDALSPQK